MRAFVLVSLLAAFPAHAGVFSTMTVVPAAAGTERKYDAATLKPQDLKSCLVDAYSIDTADALFEMARPRLEQDREELRKLRDAAGAKPSGESAAAATELRAKAQVFNAKVAALNAQVAYATDARARFSRICKDRKYFVDDLHTVRRELPVEVRDAIPLPAK